MSEMTKKDDYHDYNNNYITDNYSSNNNKIEAISMEAIELSLG